MLSKGLQRAFQSMYGYPLKEAKQRIKSMQSNDAYKDIDAENDKLIKQIARRKSCKK